MVTDDRPCTVTPCAYRSPPIDRADRCQTQLLPASRISGPVPSPLTSYASSLHW